MINIFGYGSLINPNSIANTLGRKVITSPAIIHDYYRTWTACKNVNIHNKIQPASFLDLTFKEGMFCNGVTFEIYEHELECLDCRECGYSKQDVEIFIYKNKPIQGITYRVVDGKKSNDDCVPTKYKSLVEEGLSYHNRSFKQTFLSTTEAYDGCYLKGVYKFNDRL